MSIQKIREGQTSLLVSKFEKISKKNLVFYNPEMKLSRDISVILASVLKPRSYLDALAASGVRGIRIAKESEINCKIVLNDINPKAIEFMEENAKINHVDVKIENEDANYLMLRYIKEGEKFDFIDIDPFGSPVRFIDNAIKCLKVEGFLGVTSTDTSALCGTYPKSCQKKYDAVSLRTDYYNELGLRILLGFISRCAFRNGYAVEPIFSHSTKHYFRVYLKLRKSKRELSENLENIMYIQHCFKCLNRSYRSLADLKEKCECGNSFRNAGPLWTGKLADPEICKKMLKKVSELSENLEGKELERLIGLIMEEAEIVQPYFNIHKVYKKLERNVEAMNRVIEKLEKNGFKARRTHFSNFGIKTNASVFEIYQIL